MSEKNIQSMIMLAISQQPGTCIFRNSIGRGVVGKIVKQGDVFIVHHGRVVDFGVANPGGSDLVGWKSVVITEADVGKTMAVWLALEVKTSTGRATPEQINFINAVRSAGGIAAVVRSPDEAVAAINQLHL